MPRQASVPGGSKPLFVRPTQGDAVAELVARTAVDSDVECADEAAEQ